MWKVRYRFLRPDFIKCLYNDGAFSHKYPIKKKKKKRRHSNMWLLLQVKTELLSIDNLKDYISSKSPFLGTENKLALFSPHLLPPLPIHFALKLSFPKVQWLQGNRNCRVLNIYSNFKIIFYNFSICKWLTTLMFMKMSLI